METKTGRTPTHSLQKKRVKKKAPASSPAPDCVSSKGQDLLNQVIQLTGIPADSIRRELKVILDKKNLALEQLTLEQLRAVTASYLREIIGSILDRGRPPKEPTN